VKILLTGGLGFIGSHFVDAAEAAGHEVYILDALTYAGRQQNLRYARRWHRCDIGDQLLVEHHLRNFRPDWVVNMAAESHVDRSIGHRGAFLETNVVGTARLLDACLGYWNDFNPAGGFRFLQVSTDEVYGSLSPDAEPWTEDSPYAPNNPYAASKAAGDHMARAYHRTFGLPVIVTHASNNYGTRQHPEKLIPKLISQASSGDAMTLHGDGLNVRDWLHVEDHCAGLLAALEKGLPGEVYNFGGNCARSNFTIASIVRAAVRPIGESHEIAYVNDRPGNDRRYAVNNDYARLMLGWAPREPIEERMASIVGWHLDNPDYAATYGR
jgi:dTDP-glucose 4,6-dehydratase